MFTLVAKKVSCTVKKTTTTELLEAYVRLYFDTPLRIKIKAKKKLDSMPLKPHKLTSTNAQKVHTCLSQ